MKLKRILKLGQNGVGHVELIAAVAVIAVVAVVGVYVSKYNSSHAATPSTTQNAVEYTNASTAQVWNPNVTVVTDDVYYVGNQTVVQLEPGKSAALDAGKGGGGWRPTSDCYSMRAPSSSVTAVIASGSSSEAVTVPQNLNYYSSYCIDFSKITAANPSPGFSVKNKSTSTGPLYVYQDATNEVCNQSC